MATGPEMLIQTLVKALKLEPEIDKIREALNSDLIDQFKRAIEQVNSFDARLARIEKALQNGGAEAPADPGPDLFDGDFRPVNLAPLQLRNGTGN